MKLSLDAISYGRAVFTVMTLTQEAKITDEAPSQPGETAILDVDEDYSTGPSLPKLRIGLPKLEGNFLMALALIVTLIVLIIVVVLVKNKSSGKYPEKLMKKDALVVQAELMKGKKKPGKKKKR
jgi:hypothetical protein